MHIYMYTYMYIYIYTCKLKSFAAIYKMQTLLSSSIYYTSCACNGSFHDKCLLKWIYKTQSCPICRIKFDINVEEKLPLTFNIFKIFKYICIILIIRIFYNIIIDLQYEVEKKAERLSSVHIS